MNIGTKLRTIAFAIVCVNQSIATVGDIDFGNHTINTIYKVISTVLTIIAGTIVLYYKNDFSVEGCHGTALTRYEKARKKAGYIGEDFFAGVDEADEEEESDE